MRASTSSEPEPGPLLSMRGSVPPDPGPEESDPDPDEPEPEEPEPDDPDPDVPDPEESEPDPLLEDSMAVSRFELEVVVVRVSPPRVDLSLRSRAARSLRNRSRCSRAAARSVAVCSEPPREPRSA